MVVAVKFDEPVDALHQSHLGRLTRKEATLRCIMFDSQELPKPDVYLNPISVGELRVSPLRTGADCKT